MSKEHKHTWKRAWTRGTKFIGERCACEQQRERNTTKAEAKELVQRAALQEKRGVQINKVWRKIEKAGKRSNGSWGLETDALEGVVNRFEGDAKNGILSARVDDTMFCGADFKFIPHKMDDPKLGKEYWGTTVLYFGGCDGSFLEFFMYPGHVEGMLEVLTQIKAEQDRLNKEKEAAWKRQVAKAQRTKAASSKTGSSSARTVKRATKSTRG